MANEKRLIDANALEALFDERNSDTFMQFRTRENKDYWWGVNGGINWGVNTIRDATTVDAVEVVHGRWIEFNSFMTCSECDTDWYYCDNNTDRFDFCPNCGADMRERETDES